MSKQSKKGFTLVEVTLFLAISGLLVAGIIAGTNYILAQNRYNNSIESFKDFLSGLYSQVLYPQSLETPGGRSENAMYGKLVVFGQDQKDSDKNSTVHVYSVVGNVLSAKAVSDMGNIDPLQALINAEINIKDKKGSIEEYAYTPKWGSEIEGSEADILLEKSVLIVRSPISGTISTYSYDGVIETGSGSANPLQPYYNEFRSSDINFCMNSEEKWAAGNFRRNIRINENAHNSSSIVIVNDSAGDNQCAE